MKKLMAALGLLGSLAGYASAFETAQDVTATPITSVPFVITKPGNYYLPNDLTFNPAAGTAITIEASQVILDLNGRTLKGKATGFDTTIGVVIDNRQDVIVQNGDIDAFTYAGILITDSTKKTKNQKNEVLRVNFNNDEIGVLDISGSIDVTEHCNFDGGSVGWYDISSLGGDRLQQCNFENQVANEGQNVGIAIISTPGAGVLVEDCLVSKGSNAFGEILQGATDVNRFDTFLGGAKRTVARDIGAGSN
jgi:hypothetical protein